MPHVRMSCLWCLSLSLSLSAVSHRCYCSPPLLLSAVVSPDGDRRVASAGGTRVVFSGTSGCFTRHRQRCECSLEPECAEIARGTERAGSEGGQTRRHGRSRRGSFEKACRQGSSQQEAQRSPSQATAGRWVWWGVTREGASPPVHAAQIEVRTGGRAPHAEAGGQKFSAGGVHQHA